MLPAAAAAVLALWLIRRPESGPAPDLSVERQPPATTPLADPAIARRSDDVEFYWVSSAPRNARPAAPPPVVIAIEDMPRIATIEP
jgi:hypothetical protein